MKKYMIFAISFIFLFSLFQVLSGMLLTYLYTPSVEEALDSGANLPQEVVMNSSHNSFLLTLLIAFLSATIAYLIPSKIPNKTKR